MGDPRAMTTESSGVRELVATSSRILAATGQGDLIWGHSSARDPEGRGVWLKSAEWGLEEITADRVHLVTPAGEVAAGEGPRHSEYPIHTEIMAARPDVGGVVHTHARHSVALAATGQPLRAVSHAATMFTPPAVPRFTDTADLILTTELGRALAEALGPSAAVFLVNHGIVTVGATLQDATVGALRRGSKMQVGEQRLPGAHPVVFLGDRLLDLQHQIRCGPDVVGVRQDLRPGRHEVCIGYQ